ncbi:Retrotransposon-derived protein PEG10 [Rhizoctonia solani]|uniref:Retrotransposon-derived protein PEG10 n=1 Tax=Rhizoctonia solani TaxID=456999 RepID=A0A8H8NXG7_9AGAM|nr:Retrotransposon-derived protein PEG10 [Rhizoctonia solani]QRW21916.1 Retrotransposon-derived protein PEG10 [Rhizoctonia solani]
MEPEPTIIDLLAAITALTSTVRSLQDQVKSQGKLITQLLAICKETANPVGNKDQGATQAKPGPLTGPITPSTQSGGQANTPRTARPGLSALFQPIRSTVGYNPEEEGPRREIKKEPWTECPKMELPDPYKGDTQRQKATQQLDWMLLWVALHSNQFDKEEQMVAANWALPLINNIIKGKGSAPTTIKALGLCFKEAFADPDTKRAAAHKIAALVQTASTAEYIAEFCNEVAELDWNKEACIAQFTRGLHWKVKELLSTKDNIPDNLEAIFAASIKTDNTHWENKENHPKKAAKAPVTATTSTTTTHWVCLSKDPNYVTPEEQDCCHTAGLCIKCSQNGHGIKQCPNGWKAILKETAKVAESEELGKE